MLLLADIHRDVNVLRAFADEHSLVNGGLYSDEHYSAILCVEETVGGRLAVLTCNERAGVACDDLTLVGLIAVEYGVQYALTSCVGQELTAIAEQTA